MTEVWRNFCALAVCALLLTAKPAHARGPCPEEGDRSPWYVPDYAKLQTGGYLGAITVGAGYTPWKVLELGAYYGWVPEALGGVQIHSVAARVGVRARGVCLGAGWNWVYLSGGVGALFTAGNGFFLLVPERYGDPRYYRPTGVRGLLTVGTELSRRAPPAGLLANQSVFVEVTALDEYLRLWAKSPQAEPFVSTLSTTLGFRFDFH